MIHKKKLKRICDDFSLLNEDQQDYILGILQALVFARESTLQELRDNELERSTGERQTIG